MTTPKQPVFEVGETVRIVGLHKNYLPVIVKMTTWYATVRTPHCADSERIFKIHDLEKISTERMKK